MKVLKTSIALSISMAFTFGLNTLVNAKSGIVVHPLFPASDISSDELRRIFLGKMTTWTDSSSIKPCYIGTIDEAGVRFFESVLIKDHTQFKVYWTKKLFAGDGIAPISFDTNQEIETYITQNKGAVCYSNDVSSLDKLKVKSITVDGKN